MRKRGDLTIWISDEALYYWRAERRKTPGGQHKYSDFSIERCLTLRVVFNLPLRQTQGFIRSIMRLLKLKIIVPDYTTLSRRAGQLGVNQSCRSSSDPITLIVDSTGLKINPSQALHTKPERAMDGAYDGTPTNELLASYFEGVDIIIPPPKHAVLGEDEVRNTHVKSITKNGRLNW